MKAFFKKLVDLIKMVGLFIKAIIKKVLNILARSLYIIMAIGYIASLAVVYHIQAPVKELNTMAIGYAQTANDSFKAYETVKNVSKLEDQIKDRIQEQYKVAEKNISTALKDVNEKKLGKEILFGTKIEDTSLVRNIKTQIKKSYDIDLSAEFKNLTSQQASNPHVAFILKLLQSEKIVMMVLLLASFAFLSPVVLACVVVTIMAKKYLKYVSNPNEANYINLIPSVYITNMVLAIVSVTVFYFNQDIGLVVAALTHLYFIKQIIDGIRLKNIGYCLSCDQKFPDELEEAKKIKAQLKPKKK